MKLLLRILFAFVVSFLIVSLLATGAAAGCGFPAGDYSNSCKDCTTSAPNNQCQLSCSCYTPTGETYQTTLLLNSCGTDTQVHNYNAQLVCS
ncbi:hypothetical protein COCOBI_18-1850 [Coccomyxa sp. Obi]|nr:hypothetical protein COCOBI_18-1850 [Coccomyxa sp. Obi]